MTTTDIVAVQKDEQALVAQLSELGLLVVDKEWQENLRPEDTARPPRLRISQQNRPIKLDDGTLTAPGSIVSKELGVVYNPPLGLEMFVLREVVNTRVMWPLVFDAANDPECASDGGDVPTTSTRRVLGNPQVGPCSVNGEDVCPNALWTGPKDARVSPRCTRQRNFLVVIFNDDDTYEPVILTMERTSMGAAQKLTSLMRRLNPHRPKSVLLGTVPKDDGSNQWIQYTCAEGRVLELAQQVAVRTLQVEFEAMYQEGRLKVEFDDGLQETESDIHGGAAGENPIDGGPIPGMEEPAPIDLGGDKPF